MKRLGMTVAALLMTVLLVLATAACGNNGNNGNNGSGAPDVKGTWKVKLDADKAPEDQKAMVQALAGMMEITLVLSDGGKITVDTSASVAGESSNAHTEGTWTQEGNIITISGTNASSEGAAVETDGKLEYKDGNLYFVVPETSDGSTPEEVNYMYFVKQ